MYYIAVTPEFGRGLYASDKLLAGETIEVCEVLPLSETDTQTVNTTDLKHYTFKYSDTRDCLVLGCGELFNHSDTPNVKYSLVKRGDRLVMEFKLIKDVYRAEQLFIDYNHDTKAIESYNVNLIK